MQLDQCQNDSYRCIHFTQFIVVDIGHTVVMSHTSGGSVRLILVARLQGIQEVDTKLKSRKDIDEWFHNWFKDKVHRIG